MDGYSRTAVLWNLQNCTEVLFLATPELLFYGHYRTQANRNFRSSSSRKVSRLTQTEVYTLTTPKSPIDWGGRRQLQFASIAIVRLFLDTL
jgi:hypothetical protein